jgi:hypothetical protein
VTGPPQPPEGQQPQGQVPPVTPPPYPYQQPYAQPPYGQQPYGQPPYGQPYGQPPYPYAQRGTNGLAIASMVLGIVWIYWVGSILALIFGYVARSQIRQNGQGGDGMAIAGIVLGWIGVGTLLLMVILAVSASSGLFA